MRRPATRERVFGSDRPSCPQAASPARPWTSRPAEHSPVFGVAAAPATPKTFVFALPAAGLSPEGDQA